MASDSFNVDAELSRKHQAVARTIFGLVVATILLTIIAVVGSGHFLQQSNPPLETALMLVVLFLGLGSIAWRRTKFAAMRLKDIGGLQGPGGVLQTLERTTLQLAIFGGLIALTGFVATVLTGDKWHTFRGAAVALVVLLYAYPRKAAWSRTIQYFGDNRASDTAPPA